MTLAEVQAIAEVVLRRAVALVEGGGSQLTDRDLRLLFSGTDVQAAPVIAWIREQVSAVAASYDADEEAELRALEDDFVAVAVMSLLVGVEIERARRER